MKNHIRLIVLFCFLFFGILIHQLFTFTYIVAEFDELLMISRCHAQSLRYPTIKKWFLAKYPEVAEFGINIA